MVGLAVGDRVRHKRTGRIGTVERISSSGLVTVLVAGYGYMVEAGDAWEVVE